jgi:predicted DNA-binding protein
MPYIFIREGPRSWADPIRGDPGQVLGLPHLTPDPQATRSKRVSAVMARKKISTTIYITPEQNEKLKLLHERTKVPVAVYIREGIDLVLRQHSHELPGQLALDALPHKKVS